MPTRTLIGAAAAALTLGLGAGVAGAQTSPLTTPYEAAPGHGPSISAVCVDAGIVVGYHPWDHSTRNLQIWEDGRILVNENPPDWTTWTLETGDYTVRYAGQPYQVDGDLCTAEPPTTVTYATTPLPTIPPTVDDPLLPPATIADPPATTTTVVEVVEPPVVELVTNPPTLPETGSNELPLAVSGLSLMIVGGMLVRRFGTRR